MAVKSKPVAQQKRKKVYDLKGTAVDWLDSKKKVKLEPVNKEQLADILDDIDDPEQMQEEKGVVPDKAD